MDFFAREETGGVAIRAPFREKALKHQVLAQTVGKAPMSKVVVIREWDSDVFHRRVLELESQGYLARRESYRITAEMNPETGEIIHLHTLDLYRPEPDER